MSKIDFIQIIFFFPVFSKMKIKKSFKLFARCIYGAKIVCFKKVHFFDFY